jgi:urease accessory protein
MSDDLSRAVAVLHKGDWSGASDAVSLDYAGRFLRRRRLTTDAGRAILADLPETVSLDDGDALRLDDGTVVAVRPAPEDLVEVRGPDLARLAWHIGNRHTPCQIAADRLVIRRDHVIEAMLAHLGAAMSPVTAPFRPEGGAYGHGRTLGHDHGPGEGAGPGAGHSHDRHDDAGHDHGHLRVHTHGSHRGSGSAGDDDPDGEA